MSLRLFLVGNAVLAGLIAVSPRAARAPGMVTDLRVTSVTDTTAVLTWTAVPSGAAAPARYDVHWAPAATFTWTGARPVPPLQVVGLSVAGGEKLAVSAGPLKPQTTYTFQVVAYTGTLNCGAIVGCTTPAVFGPLSNTTSATTLATPAAPPTPLVAVLTWSIRQSVFLGVPRFWKPPCLLSLTAGTTTSCGPYAVSDDSTGAVVGHAMVTVTVTP